MGCKCGCRGRARARDRASDGERARERESFLGFVTQSMTAQEWGRAVKRCAVAVEEGTQRCEGPFL